MNTATSAVIIDREHLSREGLKKAVRSCRMNVVGEAKGFTEVPNGMWSDRAPDLVVCGLDVVTGGPAVQAAILHFRRHFPATRIVVLSHGAAPADIEIAAEAGADAFLHADISTEALDRSIELVLLGQKIFPAPVRPPYGLGRVSDPSAVETDTAANGRDLAASDEVDVALSPRERQIIQALVTGLSNKGIACRLSIAEATVKVHVANLMRKLSAANRTQLAIWAIDNGFHADQPTAPRARAGLEILG